MAPDPYQPVPAVINVWTSQHRNPDAFTANGVMLKPYYTVKEEVRVKGEWTTAYGNGGQDHEINLSVDEVAALVRSLVSLDEDTYAPLLEAVMQGRILRAHREERRKRWRREYLARKAAKEAAEETTGNTVNESV